MTEKIKPIVIKIGTTSLTGRKAGEGINHEVVSTLASVSAAVMKQGQRVVIVSSGAMGLGISTLGLDNIEGRANNGELTTLKQALTSVGQVALMNSYEAEFSQHGLHAGQVLLTHRGLNDPERSSTIRRTIAKLFELNIVPIINENDTVTAAEIEFGDNDTLSAEVAALIGAETLYILTDTEGLYDSDPHKNPDAKLIHQVNKVDDHIRNIAGGSSSKTGTGGMASKIMAAEICLKAGLRLHILNIDKLGLIPTLNISKESVGTVFQGK